MISPFLPGLCHLDRHGLLHLFDEIVCSSFVFVSAVFPRLVVCSVVLSILSSSSFVLYFPMSVLGPVLGPVVVLGSVSSLVLLYWT